MKKNVVVQYLLAKQSWLAALLLLISIALGYQSFTHPISADLTQNQRNSLSQESINLLNQMPEKIEIIFFSSNSPEKGKYFRKSITEFLTRYQHHKKNISITYLDPAADSKEAMQLGLKQEGDMRIQYQHQHEFFSLPYTEERLTNLLIKLRESKKTSFFFTQGHQEPLLENADNHGWSTFAQTLKKNGYAYVQSANLTLLKPSQILVINAPQTPFSLAEAKILNNFINQGGNLIWLTENASTPNNSGALGLEDLIKNLNIEISQGIVVDFTNKQYGIDPKLVNASNYARHEIFSDYSLKTFFLSARRVRELENIKPEHERSAWKSTQLIGVAENGWLTKTDKKNITEATLADNIARHGPINIATSFEKTYKNQQQRIIVIGNSNFLANHSINIGGNKQLGLRLAHWVASSYTPIRLPTNITKDGIVLIPNQAATKYLILAIFNGFQFALPAFLMLGALLIWRRKTRM